MAKAPSFWRTILLDNVHQCGTGYVDTCYLSFTSSFRVLEISRFDFQTGERKSARKHLITSHYDAAVCAQGKIYLFQGGQPKVEIRDGSSENVIATLTSHYQIWELCVDSKFILHASGRTCAIYSHCGMLQAQWTIGDSFYITAVCTNNRDTIFIAVFEGLIYKFSLDGIYLGVFNVLEILSTTPGFGIPADSLWGVSLAFDPTMDWLYLGGATKNHAFVVFDARGAVIHFEPTGSIGRNDILFDESGWFVKSLDITSKRELLISEYAGLLRNRIRVFQLPS